MVSEPSDSGPSVVFRAAVPSDAAAVAAYHQRCVAETFASLIASGDLVPPNLDSTRAQLESWFEPTSSLSTTVAIDPVEGEEPVAHVTIEGHQVVHLFVDPAHQRTGLGRALLAMAESSIVTAGPAPGDAFELHVRVENHRAIAFYERAGWTLTAARIRTTEHGITYDEHVMVKPFPRDPLG